MNNKPLYLFVGPSASGKTSIADALEELGKNRTNTYAISKVCKGKGLSAYGYWWKYID